MSTRAWANSFYKWQSLVFALNIQITLRNIPQGENLMIAFAKKASLARGGGGTLKFSGCGCAARTLEPSA